MVAAKRRGTGPGFAAIDEHDQEARGLDQRDQRNRPDSVTGRDEYLGRDAR